MDNIIAQAAKNLKGHWAQYGDQRQDEYPEGAGCGLMHMGRLCSPNMGKADELARIMSEVAGEQYPDRSYEYFKDEEPFGPYFHLFNDHPDTTEDEVVAVMEKAAVRYDERI